MKHFLKLVKPFFLGEQKKYAMWMGLLLLALSQLQVFFGYLFIEWNRRFYDALADKNLDLFMHESWVFLLLATLVAINYSFSRYLGQCYALKWRVWMTEKLLPLWLAEDQLRKIEGSDQRIQEDLMRFTNIVEKFCLGIFNSVVMIIMFTPLLFKATSGLLLGGYNLSILIYMVVVLYTVIGMFVSIKITKPLINLEYDNQKYEANFRYHLVHARDGKAYPVSKFEGLLTPVIQNYYALYNRQKYFNLWKEAYNQLFFLIPFVLLAPNFFAGVLTFGVLMQIRSICSRIRNAMSYLLDNYSEITELLAIAKRLREFVDCFDTDKLNSTLALEV